MSDIHESWNWRNHKNGQLPEMNTIPPATQRLLLSGLVPNGWLKLVVDESSDRVHGNRQGAVSHMERYNGREGRDVEEKTGLKVHMSHLFAGRVLVA